MIIGFDIDGVLADFTFGFRQLAHQVDEEVRIHGSGAQRTWHHKDIRSKTRDRTWSLIKNSMGLFWGDLEPVVTPAEIADMRYAMQGDVYFAYVTNRPELDGVMAHTEMWLRIRGLLRNASLTITDDKVATLQRLGASAMIEDSPSNIEALVEAKFPVYVRDWPYNRGVTDAPRVGSVSEYLANVLG